MNSINSAISTDEFQTALRAVLPIFTVILIGLLVRGLGWLTEEADQSLLRVIVNLLLPCLIFDTALGNPAVSEVRNLLVAPVLGYFTAAAGIFVALSVRRLNGLMEVQAHRTFELSAGLYNYSYIAIPLAALLFDKATVGVLFVFNVGVEMCIWTLGVTWLTGGRAEATFRGVVNGPLIAIVAAVAINVLNWQSDFPAVARTAGHWLGQCAIPIALIVIGAIIADHLGEFRLSAGWRVITLAVVLRLGVIPWLFLFLAKWLPISLELKRVLVLQAAMPSAVIPIILSRLHNGHPPTAVRVVIGTSVAGLITIPVWLHFGFGHFL